MSEKANTVVALRASTTRHEKEGERREGGGRREEGQNEGGKEVRGEVRSALRDLHSPRIS